MKSTRLQETLKDSATYRSSSEKRERATHADALPIIRVIQIDSPVFVHTDVANFRSTVQSLTGSELGYSNTGGLSASAAERTSGKSVRASPDAARGKSDCLSTAAPSNPRLELNPTRAQLPYQYRTKLQSTCAQTLMQPKSTSFNEGDILAGLISEAPLPDLSMLPPLHLHSLDDM